MNGYLLLYVLLAFIPLKLEGMLLSKVVTLKMKGMLWISKYGFLNNLIRSNRNRLNKSTGSNLFSRDRFIKN